MRRFTIEIIIAIAWLANTIGAANDYIAGKGIARAVIAIGIGVGAVEFASRGVVGGELGDSNRSCEEGEGCEELHFADLTKLVQLVFVLNWSRVGCVLSKAIVFPFESDSR